MTKMLRKVAQAVLLAAMLLTACDGQEQSEPPGGATVELTYRVRPVDGGATTRHLVRATAAHLRARLRDLEPGSTRVRPAGADRIRIVTPDSARTREAVDAATDEAALRIYDWEPNVLGDRGPDAPFAGGTALYDAVKLASASKPSAVRAARDATDRYYLFGPDRRPLGAGGPAQSCDELLAPYRRASGSRTYPADTACREQLEALAGGGPPAGSRVLRVPAGIAVLEAQRLPGQPAQIRRYFVIEDDFELASADVKKPRADADTVTGDPMISFEFTARGRRAFKRLTARLARRGARAASAAGRPEQSFQRFAIAIDNRIISLASVDFLANPDGIDSPGGQINGLGSLRATRLLARSLAARPLEAELELVSMR